MGDANNFHGVANILDVARFMSVFAAGCSGAWPVSLSIQHNRAGVRYLQMTVHVADRFAADVHS